MIAFKISKDEFKSKIATKVSSLEEQLKNEELKKHIAYEPIMQAWSMLKGRYELMIKSPYLPEEVSLDVDEMALYIGTTNEFKIIERRQGGVVAAYEIHFGDFVSMIEVHHSPAPEMPGGLLDFDTLKKMNAGDRRRPRR